MIRIGHGFDLHRLIDEPSGYMTVGGVKIPHHKSIQAHSDGDVVYHALTDALLGALALGDIGQWFPDNDPQFKNKPSDFFLKKVYEAVLEKEYRLGNLDVTIIAEKPKLKPHIPMIKDHLIRIFSTQIENISIKAKTHEQCDAIGQEEAIAAHAVVLLKKKR